MTQSAAASRPGRKHRGRRLAVLLLPPLFLLALVAATWRGALDNDFHFDDRPNIVQNAATRMEVLSLEGLARAARESPLERRPLAYVTFALDWWRGGGEARAFQQTNIALHAATACLVYALLLLVLARGRDGASARTSAAAAAGAALWAVHPVQTQAVTYVVQRMAEMATFFTLLAVLVYLLARSASGRGRAAVLYVLSAVAVVAGALSKENAWMAPVVLVLAELTVMRREGRLFPSRRWKVVAAAVGLVAVLSFLVTAAGLGPLARYFETGYGIRDFTMVERLLTQPRVVFFHLSQVLWPSPGRFSLEHDFEVSRSLLDPATTLLALAAVGAWCAGGLWLLRRQGACRTAAFFVLWVPLTLLIESSFVPLEMVFEHRMYLPVVGIAGLFAMGLSSISHRLPRPVVTAGVPALAVVGLLVASTLRYLPVWRTPVSLAENSVRHAPGSSRAWQGLGQAYLRDGQAAKAEEALHRALDLDPDELYSLEFLAVVHFDRGELDEAERLLLRALAGGSQSSSLYNHLGEVKLARGDHLEAEYFFRLARGKKPWVAVYRWNLALALEGLGRCEEASAEWREYLRLERDDEASREQVRGHLRVRHETPGGACYRSPAEGEGR